MVVGAVVGGVLGLIFLMAVVYCLALHMRRKKDLKSVFLLGFVLLSLVVMLTA